MKFWKYQGAGNDFVMIDQREQNWLSRADTNVIHRLCDRRFGIGADGLILLQNRQGFDFEMVYFNADGRESTMCGNGGRCIAAFAQHLGIVGTNARFWAIDGEHEASIGPRPKGEYEPSRFDSKNAKWVELKMIDVDNIDCQGNVFVLNTGSPHYVRFEEDVLGLDMVQEGRAVRYSDKFNKEGINVNLVHQKKDGSLVIRTYERGVEDETLACGTGVTAAALASSLYQGLKTGAGEIHVNAQGGNLSVRFKSTGNGAFSDIWLCGPAELVFEGNIEL